MSAIRCEGLRKTYGRITALDGLDLDIPEGTIFGFLGPNGAGKTTTVKLLTGLGVPTAGRAWVADEPVAAGSMAFRARVGYLSEEPAFYGWMTGREFLCHIGRLFRLPDKAASVRADELLAQVGLAESGRRRIGGYSRGMRQRLGLAQALVNHPRVLFLDEPCSALDPIGRKDVLAAIRALRGSATVFMSSHILADVERVCDWVAVIDRGRLLISAAIEELRAKYARPIVEIQLAEDDEPLALTVAVLPWVSKVERAGEGNGLRVFALDGDIARRELPRLVAASGSTLLRYEVVAPSLEDIFVSLVGPHKERGQ